MLGLPPAFVLSQDQTLKLKRCYQRILDVRTSAHHLIDPAGSIKTVCCISNQSYRKPTNSEAVLYYRAKTLRARYAKADPSIRTKLPAYLFSVLSMSNSVEIHQSSKPQRQKQPTAPNIIWRRSLPSPQNYNTRTASKLSLSADPAIQPSVAASVKAYLHKPLIPRKRKMTKKYKKLLHLRSFSKTP